MAALFHRDCPKEKDVVLKMDMLVKVALKFSERAIECLIAGARPCRRAIAVTQGPHIAQQVPGGRVLMLHHRDRVLHGAEWRRCYRFTGDHRLFEPRDVGEQDELLFSHVSRQFLRQQFELTADIVQFGMLVAMDAADLLKQRSEAANFLARVGVVVCPERGASCR